MRLTDKVLYTVANKMIDSAIENIKNKTIEMIDGEEINWEKDMEWIFDNTTNFKDTCYIAEKDFNQVRIDVMPYFFKYYGNFSS